MRLARAGAARGSLILGLLLSCAPASAAEPSALRIGRINIRSLNVFSPEEAAAGWVYRLADSLHVTSRTQVIRRFLLFREGEPYDPELLAQTERNLRQLPFLKLASVVGGPPHDGVVDVDVITQDGWSTEIGGSFGSRGGTTTYGVDLSEKNLAGTGREVAVGYDEGTDRTVRSVEFQDPYLFAPYWSGALMLATTSDGYQRQLEVQRPFFSFTAPWQTDLLFQDLRLNEKIYQDGEISARFRQDHQSASALYGVALSAQETRARRLTAGFDSEVDNFRNLPDRPADQLPNARNFRYIFAQYDDVANEFLKLNYVNKDLRYEDFNLGRSISLRLGISPSALGPEKTTGLLSASVSQGWRLGLENFVLGTISYSTRLGPINADAQLSANFFLAWKPQTDTLQTFVARLRVDRGWELDRDVQFFADGLTGLRAYHLYAFEGNKRVILNLEYRLFSGREILNLVAPGAVAFVDTGTAVPPGVAWTHAAIKTDAGVGLRFGIARAPSNNILRIDLAYALNPYPLGHRGFLISFSSSQAF